MTEEEYTKHTLTVSFYKAWLEQARERIEELEQALLGSKTGDCWCPVGIGNPMMRDHTDNCKKIQELMKTVVNTVPKGE